ncbi:unnamed protein product, partial [Gongylonema pulchrum]
MIKNLSVDACSTSSSLTPNLPPPTRKLCHNAPDAPLLDAINIAEKEGATATFFLNAAAAMNSAGT